MGCDKHTMLLYAITGSARGEELYKQVEAALRNGITCLQLRAKDLDDEALYREAVELAKLCRPYGVPFIVNDRPDIAQACGADGVHVGQGDMALAQARSLLGKDSIIGVSAHTVEEALAAQQGGADYLGVGAVFATATKANARPLPPSVLREICAAVSLPIVAIGGINEDNILELSGSGVDGAAVISAIFGQPDPGAAAARMAELSARMVKGS